jgi:hypothetical protein
MHEERAQVVENPAVGGGQSELPSHDAGELPIRHGCTYVMHL